MQTKPGRAEPGRAGPRAANAGQTGRARLSRYDVVVAGGGHNGLAAAAYLAQAGQSVLVLERLRHTGGHTGERGRRHGEPSGVPARVSRYSYLVSLLPSAIARDLGLRVELRPRRIGSYTPAGGTGLLVDTADGARTAASFAAVTGSEADWKAWQRFYAGTLALAGRLFPTMTEPLRSRAGMRALAGDDAIWEALVSHPVAAVLEERFADDTVRGVVATDALIGTFARVGEPSLVQNRCFLYHVIGNGTGAWNVPVGGMGALSAALEQAALAAGAEIRTGAEVTGIDPDGEVRAREGDGEYTVGAGHILANLAPATLAGLLQGPHEGPASAPEGAQLKINMVLSRLPRLRDAGVSSRDAFAGTFHVNEGYAALDDAYAQASAGRVPSAPPCEAYCHSLTDSSILDPALAASGAHTMTVFGLHMPARLFRADPAAARDEALRATLRSIDGVLAEPLADCLLLDSAGNPCLEVKTPVDLEAEAGLPGGHIFHGDLSWPWADDPADVGRWGVETEYPRLLLCGAGARRGGGVSAIGGHNAAMALLRGPAR
ncbi:MAG TPA: NAD(P)-binding protein [Streptosporangiaceae bacterium]|nr:NAD(P)-binding protein [Streptosporangiaceae bacterium]